MVASGLSQLGRSGCGQQLGFVRLHLTGTTLADAGAVTHCTALQHACLARNRLSSLRPLGALALASLDASCNCLTQVPAPAACKDCMLGCRAVPHTRLRAARCCRFDPCLAGAGLGC